MSKTDKYLIIWHLTSLATVLIPLLIFAFAKIVMGDVDKQQEKKWWEEGWDQASNYFDYGQGDGEGGDGGGGGDQYQGNYNDNQGKFVISYKRW